MSRVKRSVHARKKRRATLERAKGYRGEANSNYKRAKEALIKADSYAYRDRRNRKRDFRRLWITRINAAARQNGMSYGQFMHGLKLAGIELDRKVLADIAVRDADTFRRFADAAREASAAPERRQNDTAGPRRAPLDSDGALFVAPTMITSSHNDKLKESAAAALASVRRTGRFVAEGEDLLAAADAAGWEPLERYVAAGSGLGRHGGRAGRCSPASRSWARARGRSAVYRERWAQRPRGRCCVDAVGRARSRQRRHRAALRPGLRRRPASRSGPGCADPYGPKAVRASMGAPLRAAGRPRGDRRRAARARPSRSWRGPESRCAVRRPVPSPSSSAPSGRGCPSEVVAACDARRPHPDRLRIAERGHGRDGRPLRTVPRTDERPHRPDRRPRPVEAIAQASTSEALEQVRVQYLGRKAELPKILRGVAELPPEERGGGRQGGQPGPPATWRAR